MTKKGKEKTESAVAKARVKAGRSALVSLKPKPAFSARLTAATTVLVQETVTINGSKRTHFRQLKVVH
jgi:hypothetical protein